MQKTEKASEEATCWLLKRRRNQHFSYGECLVIAGRQHCLMGECLVITVEILVPLRIRGTFLIFLGWTIPYPIGSHRDWDVYLHF